MAFHRLEKLTIDDASLGLLSDDFLLAATQKRTDGDGTPTAAFGSEQDYPELSDGVLPFLFREDIKDERDRIELHFPAARVEQDFGQKLLDHATSTETSYSIQASFVAVTDVSDKLVGYEEYRLPDYGDDGVVYGIPGLSEDGVVVELKITKIAAVRISEEPGRPPTSWKLIKFRRYRESVENNQYDENGQY